MRFSFWGGSHQWVAKNTEEGPEGAKLLWALHGPTQGGLFSGKKTQ